MGTPVATPKRSAVVDAGKKAEELFQTKNIAEIREFEAQTRKDIESKKIQLRQLVGDSYRDLIESADKIVSIAKSCDAILSNVISVQEGFSTLTSNVSSSFKAPVDKARSLKNHEVLYAIGSRMKYLLETPEMIWGCLDSQQYIQAARRYVRAQDVYRLLTQNFPPELLAKFPLLGHQWPQVKKFREQILEGVHTRLVSSIHLSSGQVSDAVVAATMLDDSGSSTSALQLFLSARRQWLQNELQGEGARSGDVEHIAGVLATVATGLMDTISQVGEVFLWTDRVAEPSCLLATAAKEDETETAELIFRGSPGSGADDSQSLEVKSWFSFNHSLLDRLPPVPNSQAEQACSDFTAGVSKDLTAACRTMLLPCDDALGLCRVEAAVRAALMEWKPPAKPNRSATPKGGDAGWRGKGDSETWEMVCEFVLGRPLPVWQDLFHAPFTNQAKLLIDQKFLCIRTQIEGPLDDALTQVTLGDASPVGAVRIAQWPLIPLHSNAAAWTGFDPSINPTHSSPTKRAGPSRASWDGAGVSAGGSRVHAYQLLHRLEQQLQQTLSDCVLLLGDSSTSAYATHLRSTSHYNTVPRTPTSDSQSLLRALSGVPGTPMATPLAVGTSRKDLAARAAELEPFIQQKSAEMATGLAALLQSRADSLPSPDPSDKGASVVEQLLLIAQLCSSLGGDSTFLQMTAGGIDGWKGSSSLSFTSAARSVSSYARGLRPGGMLGGVSSKQQQLAEAFRNVAVKCFRVWAVWVAGGLTQQLLRALHANDLLSINTTPAAWEETVVSPIADTDTQLDAGEDMRFYLPACPSPEVLSMLIGACSEISRAGDYAIDSEALQILQWEVMGAILQTYHKFLLPPPSGKRKVSEKGVLQLLLDVRFLKDVLSSGRPALSSKAVFPASQADVSTPDVTTTLSERKREIQALEASLQDTLDPIDWATYEPYLASNSVRYLQRCSAVLGMLTQAQRSSSTAATEAVQPAAAPRPVSGPAKDFNPLNVMAVTTRFQYLPISTPTSHAAAAQNTKARAAAAGNLLGLQWISGSQDNPSENFSFSTLSTGGMSATSAGAAAELSGLDAGGSSTALGALQARIQAGGLGTFSSLLGDKAAEMTAIAQQRLEGMGLHDLGQGLFSSLAKGVVRG